MPGGTPPFPYDSHAYGQCLSYLGVPETIPGLPWPVIIRTIPGSERSDAMGPWPYGSPLPTDQATRALRALRARGVVSLTAFFRPDRPVDVRGLRRVGFECTPLKPHFMFDPREPLPKQSKKTRYNVATARRRWTVRPLDLRAAWPLLAVLHHDLSRRRSMSRIAHVDAWHFERLADVPGAVALGAFEDEDPSAALVVVKTGTSVHFHALVGDERAYRKRGFYALYDDALRRWGNDYLLCMGGAPSGPDGPGIEKFKRRFATSTRPVLMLKAIVDPHACAALTARSGASDFFPPYRSAVG